MGVSYSISLGGKISHEIKAEMLKKEQQPATKEQQTYSIYNPSGAPFHSHIFLSVMQHVQMQTTLRWELPTLCWGWNNNLKTSEAFIVSYSSTESNDNSGLFILLSSKYEVPIKHLQTSTKKKLKKGFCSFPAQFSLTLLEPQTWTIKDLLSSSRVILFCF